MKSIMTRKRANQILKYLLINFFFYNLSISAVSCLNIEEMIDEFDLDDLFPGLELKSLIPGGDLKKFLHTVNLNNVLPAGQNLNDLMPEIQFGNLLSGNVFNVFKNGPALISLFNQINKLKDWQQKAMLKAENYYRSKHPKSDGFLRCVLDLKGIKNALPELWILSLLDASFKPPTGILGGGIHWPGSFDQCRRYKTPKRNKLALDFKGQYCSINLFAGMANKTQLYNFPILRFGVCVPDSCGNDELDALLSSTKDIPTVGKLLQYVTTTCVPESYPYNSGSIIVLTFLGMACCFILFATLYDFVLQRKFYKIEQSSIFVTENHPPIESENSKIINALKTPELVENKKNGKWRSDMDSKRNIVVSLKLFVTYNIRNFPWHCFSAIRNLESIFDTSSSKDELECIHGIRVISMLWIILGHTCLCAYAVSNNLVEKVKEVKSDTYQIVNSAFYAVDTFYTLSGFLLAYWTFKKMPNLNFKWIGYMILHRYCRLVPVYVVIISLHATVFKLIGNGPYWDLLPSTQEMCAKYWWRNLLFLNNLFPGKEACISIAWHIANDMQYFIISPVFFYVLSRKMKYVSGVTVMILFSFLALIIRLFILYNANVWDTVESQWDLLIKSYVVENDFGYRIYIMPYGRIGPYIVGYLVGYLQVRWQESLKIPQSLINFTWATAGITAYVMCIQLYTYPLGKHLLIWFISSSRVIWSLIVCWVILASLNGYGGIVNRILSAKIWIPLSRLTYCAYFVHMMYLEFYFFSRKTPFHLEYLTTLLLYAGFVAVTYGLALPLSLIFEAPLLKLEKHLKSNRISPK